ncbi:hypothetical protein [Moorena sp. SIO4G3]|uniref:hypothetical protein n=1 Tax=Moorena sp. SIO4G3 TaxID=2607821 RepID=UPI00142A58BD|nr:hypothetical protein [Moorena sp. SIO4G3]NEO79410.1 hypothetical protein [Moorena sp. SIO4G3]
MIQTIYELELVKIASIAGKYKGCISFLLFDSVVRYGADFPKAGYELENDGEPPLTHPT